MALAALLGGIQGLRQPIGADGGIHPGQAHPWLMQLQFDVKALGRIDEHEDLIRSVTLRDGRINFVQLLTELRSDFTDIDVTTMRRQYFSTAIPPAKDPVVAAIAAAATQTGAYQCELSNDDGSQCGQRFPTLKGLAQHQRLAGYGDHGSRCYLTLLIQSPQCPLCKSFSKKRHDRTSTRTAVVRKFHMLDGQGLVGGLQRL